MVVRRNSSELRRDPPLLDYEFLSRFALELTEPTEPPILETNVEPDFDVERTTERPPVFGRRPGGFLGWHDEFRPTPQVFPTGQFREASPVGTQSLESANVQESEDNSGSEGGPDGRGDESRQNSGGHDDQGEQTGGCGGDPGKDSGDGGQGAGSSGGCGGGSDGDGPGRDGEDQGFEGDGKEEDNDEEDNDEEDNSQPDKDEQQGHQGRDEKDSEESQRKQVKINGPVIFLRRRQLSLNSIAIYNAEYEYHLQDNQKSLEVAVSLAKERLSPKSENMKVGDSNLCCQAVNVDGSTSEMLFIDDPPKILGKRSTYRKVIFYQRSVSVELPAWNHF